MIKKNFEIFKKNSQTLGVIAKEPRLAKRLNKRFQNYQEPFKPIKGEEALFWVALADKDALRTCLRLRGPLTLDLGE